MMRWRMLVATAALVAALGSPLTARAGYLEQAGWGTLTMVSNLVYMPAKLVYAGLGGLCGGLAYAATVGDLEPAETVWRVSMGGSYVLTTRMLRGEEPIAFAAFPALVPEQTASQAESTWPGIEVEDDSFASVDLDSDRQAFGDDSLGGF